jgi:hypothetical protein
MTKYIVRAAQAVKAGATDAELLPLVQAIRSETNLRQRMNNSSDIKAMKIFLATKSIAAFKAYVAENF